MNNTTNNDNNGIIRRCCVCRGIVEPFRKGMHFSDTYLSMNCVEKEYANDPITLGLFKSMDMDFLEDCSGLYRRKLLIVDRDTSFAVSLETYLESFLDIKNDFDIITVDSVENAWKIMQESKYTMELLLANINTHEDKEPFGTLLNYFGKIENKLSKPETIMTYTTLPNFGPNDKRLLFDRSLVDFVTEFPLYELSLNGFKEMINKHHLEVNG